MDKWQEIFAALSDAGLEVYPPGGHIGICTAPYCVVQENGASIPNGSRRCGKSNYRIYLVVPIEQPAAMQALADSVRRALRPMVESGALELSTPRAQTMPDDLFSALISYTDYTCCYSERN